MKKIFLFLAMAGMAAFTTGCSNDDNVDAPVIAKVIQTPPINFTSQNNFTGFIEFAGPTYEGDVIVVYRRTVVDGFTVWQQIPRTIYFDTGGELDYDFNFTANDIEIFMVSDGVDLNFTPAYTLNQVFRIAILPGNLVYGVDLNNYNEVMSAIEHNGGDARVRTIEN